MSRETDIVRAACLMISHYGADANPVARRRIRELAVAAPKASGDWELVASAIRMIENDASATFPEGPKLPADLADSVSGFDLPRRGA